MTVFSNVRIFDGESAALIDGKNVFVKGDRIAEVSDRPPTPEDGPVIAGRGRTLMPGLIDAHIHAFSVSANPYEWAAAPPSLATGWANVMLGRALDRGFTTVRDTGGADYGLYLALERGWIRGPRLYYCGRAISQTGGHVDFRNPHSCSPHDEHILACGCAIVTMQMAVVDGVDAVRRIVRENLRRGSNFIKFTGSGGVTSTGDSLDSIQFADDEVLAIVDEVERHGAYCTAHIHPDKALKRAVKLGVHCIEHGTLIEPDTARMCADKGVYIVPTMAVVAALAKDGKAMGFPPQSLEKLDRVKDEAVGRMAHMRSAGVKVGFGSDLIGPTEKYQCTEFSLRKPIFSNHEILVQATSMNAEIIGAKGELGVVRPGALADLLVVDGNPLEDLAVLEKDGAGVDIILKGGQFAKGSIASQIASPDSRS